MMPPQLHGNSLLKVITAPMYSVKAIISSRDAYNPFSRQRGIINNIETMNSVKGKLQAMNDAKGFKMGESAICSLKTPYSISLLMPVYKNSMTNSMEMISTMVLLVIHVNNRLLCCITGPSMVIWLIMFNGYRFLHPATKPVKM
jgi:hypothetical protein